VVLDIIQPDLFQQLQPGTQTLTFLNTWNVGSFHADVFWPGGPLPGITIFPPGLAFSPEHLSVERLFSNFPPRSSQGIGPSAYAPPLCGRVASGQTPQAFRNTLGSDIPSHPFLLPMVRGRADLTPGAVRGDLAADQPPQPIHQLASGRN